MSDCCLCGKPALGTNAQTIHQTVFVTEENGKLTIGQGEVTLVRHLVCNLPDSIVVENLLQPYRCVRCGSCNVRPPTYAPYCGLGEDPELRSPGECRECHSSNVRRPA